MSDETLAQAIERLADEWGRKPDDRYYNGDRARDLRALLAEHRDEHPAPEEDGGLHDKYRVERRHDPEGKHDACRYFVLDPQHDPIAVMALRYYATQTRRTGLGRDLHDWLDTLAGSPHPTPEPPSDVTEWCEPRYGSCALLSGHEGPHHGYPENIRRAAAALTRDEHPTCTTEGCGGDGRYAAPGRGHIEGCTYPIPAPEPPSDVTEDENLAALILGVLIRWVGEAADLDDCREITAVLAPAITAYVTPRAER